MARMVAQHAHGLKKSLRGLHTCVTPRALLTFTMTKPVGPNSDTGVIGFSGDVDDGKPLNPAVPGGDSYEIVPDNSLPTSPVQGSLSGWRRFLAIPPPLRTWLTTQMIYVEETLDFLKKLKPEDLTPEVKQQLVDIIWQLEVIVHDLQSPYLENGSLSLLGVERLQNLLFRVGAGSILRVNINMTDANKLDTSGRLGTAFKNMVLTWLQKEFGVRHVSLNPEGTSFLAINVGPHEISCSLSRFDREIKFLLMQEDVQKQYEFDPKRLADFNPLATSMFLKVTAEGLDVDEIVKTGDKQLILDLQRQMMTRIVHSLRLLAAGVTAVEKEGPEKFGLTAFAGGLSVFDGSQLPKFPGMAGFEKFQEYLSLGIGYYPAAEYHSHLDGDDQLVTADENLEIHPRKAHKYGWLDHQEREGDGGGASQVLTKAINAVVAAQSQDEKEKALKALQDAVAQFAIISTIAEEAEANPRNRRLSKWIQEVRLHDGTKRLDSYFFEKIALRPESTIHIIVFEVDSFKAFLAAHPMDEADSNNWGITDQFFIVAKKRSLDPPIITQVGGDLFAAAEPPVDKSGRPVDLADYIPQILKRVAGVYQDKPFQDYAKVEVPNGNGKRVERWPLWRVGNDIVPSMTQPKGGKPFIRTLSISAVGTTIPRPRSSTHMKLFFNMINNMAKMVDDLKERVPPYRKGRFAVVSPEQLQEPSPLAGYYVPKEARIEGARVADFEVMGDGGEVDQSLRAVWGDEWTRLPSEMRRNFIDRLSTMLHRERPHVLTHAMVRNIFSGMGHPMPRVPAMPIMLVSRIPHI